MTEPVDPTVLRAKINGETGQIAWTGLQRFFAQGRVIVVARELDLVETAAMVAGDHAEQVAAWTSDGRIGKVSDEQARFWLESDALLWTVVVKPWVLVQETDPPDGQASH